MIATLAALAMAGAVGPPELVKVGRCYWERPPAAVVAKPQPATGVVKPPVRKKRVASPTPPRPDDELIGCDEDGPVWTSENTSVEFWPPEAPPVKISRVAPDVPAVPSGNVPTSPPTETFIGGCDCGGFVPVPYPVFVGGGGGGIFVPHMPPTAIPEPSTWALLAAGLLLLLRRTRRT